VSRISSRHCSMNVSVTRCLIILQIQFSQNCVKRFEVRWWFYFTFFCTSPENAAAKNYYQTVNDGVAHSKNPKKCAYHVTFDLDPDLEHTLDACRPGVHLVKVWWHPAICLREEVICAKVYRRTDRGTDRRRTPRHCISSFLEWAKNWYTFAKLL